MNQSPIGYDMGLLRPCMVVMWHSPHYSTLQKQGSRSVYQTAPHQTKHSSSSIAVCATVMFSQNYLKDISPINCKYL